jgi:hypothetical protein
MSEDWTEDEKNTIYSRYGCQLLFEKTNLQQVKDPSLPSDAHIVVYEKNGETFMDLCRGDRVKIFDLYHDKFGSGSIKKIDWGYGRVSPKLWGYKPPEGKKKR